MIRTTIALLLTILLLVAGTPWDLRTHWCGGHLADWSLLGDQPGCGMEEGEVVSCTDVPVIDAVPCCANEVLQIDAVPSFIKVIQERTVIVPIAIIVPLFILDISEHDESSSFRKAHPPDIVPTGQDILVRVQRFLI